jgi:hypothetical protein
VNLTRLVDPATSRPLRFLLPPSYRSCPLFSDKGKQLRRQLSCRSSASLKRIHLAHSSPFGSKCDHCGEFGDTLEWAMDRPAPGYTANARTHGVLSTTNPFQGSRPHAAARLRLRTGQCRA